MLLLFWFWILRSSCIWPLGAPIGGCAPSWVEVEEEGEGKGRGRSAASGREHRGSAFSRGTSPRESELEGRVAFGNWKLVGQGRTEQGQADRQRHRDTDAERGRTLEGP